MIKINDNMFIYTYGEPDGPFECEHLDSKTHRDCNERCWNIITSKERDPKKLLKSYGVALCDEHMNERMEHANRTSIRTLHS